MSPPERLGSECIRRCLMRRCTRQDWPADPVRGLVRSGCRSPGPGCPLHAAGASALRVRLRQDVAGVLSLVAADAAGAPVVSVDSLVLRPMPAGQLAAFSDSQDDLFAVEWAPVRASGVAGGRWAVAGAGHADVAADLAADGVDARGYPGLEAVGAVGAGMNAQAARSGGRGGAGAGAGMAGAGPAVAGNGCWW